MTARRRLHLQQLEDRLAPAIDLISINPAGAAGDGRSTIGVDVNDQQMSADGRYVVFHTLARDLTPEPDNGEFGFDVYVRDTVARTTELVSRTQNEAEGGAGFGQRISADGRYVLFNAGRSEGPDGLVPSGSFGPVNYGEAHLYRRDLWNDTTGVVTAREDGLGGGGGLLSGSGGVHFDMSDDGRYVVFAYSRDDLVAGDTNGQPDVFIRDLVAGTTKLVSHTAGGISGNGASVRPIISGNGRTVVFVSNASNLTGVPDTNGDNDLFTYDVATGEVKLLTIKADASAAAGGALRGTKVFFHDVDSSGTKVLFSANSDQLVPNGVFGEVLYLHDLSVSETSVLSRLPSGAITGVDGSGCFISGDGKFAVLQTDVALTNQGSGRAVYVCEIATSQFTLASRSPAGQRRDGVLPSISHDGRFIAFASGATDMVPGVQVLQGNSQFVFDRLTGLVFAMNTDLSGTTAFGVGNDFNKPYISANGRKVAFFSYQTLGFTDTNNNNDVFANDVPLFTAPTISDVVDQSTIAGVALGPIAVAVDDLESLPADLVVSAVSSDTTIIPDGNIFLGGSGANRTLTINPAPGRVGIATITLTVTDPQGLTSTDRLTVTVERAPAVLVGYPQFVAGADVGGSQATAYNPDGSARFSLNPFPGFTGGVRTAAADFTGDGVADVVVGTGPGRATRVIVFDGVTQQALFTVDPFEPSFTGGVYVATGDVNGDGVPDLAITPDEGGGPRVDIYSGGNFSRLVSFFGIDDASFRGGARASIADITGDGRGDLIVVAGFGGGPRVSAYDGTTLTGVRRKVFNDFFAFEQSLRNGIFVAAGDLNGDGIADLVAGGGPGGGPRVLVFDGASLLSNEYVHLANFFGGDPNSRGGIRLTVKDLDVDSKADLVVGSGTGAGSRVTAYLGVTLAATGTPPTTLDFDSFAGFGNGVFVG
ncbi:MAG: FG-GAP-like repeat-containing protein [Gemmataceae bacterium]